MQITKINKTEYELLISNSEQKFKPSFMQMPFWGDVKVKSADYSVENFEIKNEEDSIGCFQMLVKNYFGLFMIGYIPRGRILFDPSQIELLKIDLELSLKNLGYSAILWEYDLDFDETAPGLDNIGFPINLELQPALTIVNDLRVQDIMAAIPSKNARRNIKRGLKKVDENGMEFSVVTKITDQELDRVYELMQMVGDDKEFSIRSIEYYRNLQNTVPDTIWFIFRKEGEIVLANLGIIFNGKYSDLYVGKIPDYDRDYLSYVLKFNSFMWLKENGYSFYDHWGYTNNQSSPKYNYSQFKAHFGGKIINFPKIRFISKYPRFISEIGLKLFGSKLG